MNKFILALSKVSPNFFGFYGGGEYIVCVMPYPRTTPAGGDFGYIDGYYAVSNSQYHKTREFLAFCKSCGCVVEIEREKGYKDFLFDNGFFGKGKNSLLYDSEFGSKIYFTVLKVAKLPQDRENRLEFVKFLQILKSKQSRYKKVDSTCGACRLCLSACPQKAIPSNLENCLRAHMQDGCVSAEISKKLGSRVLGCEICSEVCPKNSKVAQSSENSYQLFQLLELVEKKDPTLCEKYGKNIISKNKLIPYILNSMGNSKNPEYLPILQQYTKSDNANVKSSAEIALSNLEKEVKDEPN